MIARVAERKWTLYGGTCCVCGGPTQGNTKGQPPPEFCSKPACRSEQRDPWKRLIREGRHVTGWKHSLTTTRSRKCWKGVCSCGWQSKRHIDLAKVEAAYKDHTRLIEREGKRAADGA